MDSVGSEALDAYLAALHCAGEDASSITYAPFHSLCSPSPPQQQGNILNHNHNSNGYHTSPFITPTTTTTRSDVANSAAAAMPIIHGYPPHPPPPLSLSVTPIPQHSMTKSPATEYDNSQQYKSCNKK